MTVTYGFYNSLAGDRKYDAVQLSRLFEGIITDGIFQNIGSALAVSHIPSTMTINVAPGRAWFNNTWTNNDSNLVLTVLASEAVLNRIDSVILEVNSDTGTRANTIKVIKGTPASTPVAPTLANTATLKQYTLADIYVGAGVTNIGAANITNKRGSVATPFITGILGTIDVTTLFTQYDAQFSYWFTNLVNQLSGSQVTNLQAQIDAMNNGWIAISGTTSYVSADSPVFTMNVVDAQATTIELGNRIKLTQTTDKYFIVVKKGTPSGGYTPITVYGGTDYTLANAAITNVYCSRVRSPKGFPTDPNKWTVLFNTNTAYTITTVTGATWYGGSLLTPSGPSLDIPIGVWNVSYKAMVDNVSTLASPAPVGVRATLSSSQNSESDPDFSGTFSITLAAGTVVQRAIYRAQKVLNITTKTTYFINIYSGVSYSTSLTINTGSTIRTIISAVCAYL